MLRQGIARLSSKQVRNLTPSVNRIALSAAKHTPTKASGIIFQAVRAISSTTSGPKQLLPKQLAIPFSRTFATQVSENPFLNWHLFPDFQNLLTQCKPATAIPIFEKFLDNAEQQFKQLEANFTPTWDGSIGLGEIC